MTSSGRKEVHRVAIVGAGLSGLGAIKHCLEEHLEPVCYDQRPGLGGLWNYSETVIKGWPSVIKTTITTVCKETYSFSDFPPPDDFPVFYLHSKFLEYLRLYCDKFDLEKYIQFDTEVVEIVQTCDFSSTGRWQITVKNLNTGECTTEVFDAVLVCGGCNSKPLTPQYEGANVFKGIQLNACDYRHSGGFEGKRIVVMGIGNSAVDIACDLSRVCSQVFLSTRGGTWVLSRLSNSGRPIELDVNRRVLKAVVRLMPQKLLNHFAVKTFKSRLNHKRFGLEPVYTYANHTILLTDELPSILLTGKIKLKCGIKHLTDSGVVFDDGTVEDNIDAVIYGTGYTFDFPYLKHSAFEVKDGQMDFYKHVFPTSIWPPTIAAIGYTRVLGSLVPASELQGRWAVAVFKGKVKLPSEEDMQKHVKLSREKTVRLVGTDPKLALNCDWNEYMDSVAEEIGCKPNILKLFFTDPKLATALFFGPTTPFDYRLTGPGTWPPARQTILTLWDRIYGPLLPRKIERNKETNGTATRKVLLVSLCVTLFCVSLAIFI